MRTRRLGSLVVVATAALVVGACTGDGDIEVLVDDGTDPSVLLGEAIERTAGLSGRYTQTIVMEFSGLGLELGEDPESGDVPLTERVEVAVDGEFDGSDLRAVMTVSDGNEVTDAEWRATGEAVYRTVDPTMDAEIIDLLDGRTWIEDRSSDLSSSAESGDPLDALFLGRPSDLVGLLGSIESAADEVVLLDPGEIDGSPHRRFAARLHMADDGWFNTSAGFDGEAVARAARIAEYRHDHLAMDVEVWVDAEGFVRRVVAETFDDVEPQYRECFLLFGAFGDFAVQVDLGELGTEVEIVAPDPSDLVTADEYEQLMGWGPHDDAALDALREWDGEGTPPLPDEFDEEVEWEATEGDRDYLEERIGDYAVLLDIDPATLPERSLDELAALEEQLEVALEQLPTYDTPLGPHNEFTLREMVRMGMEWEDVDPALADDLTPEQLVELMEAYLSNPDSALGPAGGFGGDEMFEGCPA